MPISHDPSSRARLTYSWLDERHHLIDGGGVHTVVVISDTVSKGDPYPTAEEAERAYWQGVATSILATDAQRVASAFWPEAEVAVLLDHGDGRAHLAERGVFGFAACPYATAVDALKAWRDRVRTLLDRSE